jgi:hypothetical protein
MARQITWTQNGGACLETAYPRPEARYFSPVAFGSAPEHADKGVTLILNGVKPDGHPVLPLQAAPVDVGAAGDWFQSVTTTSPKVGMKVALPSAESTNDHVFRP